jgi:hypothetical protein
LARTSKRLRLAILGSVVLGVLIAVSFQARKQQHSALREFDWGTGSGNGVLNAVSLSHEPDRAGAPFSYYTGARSRDSGPLTAAPTRIFAGAAHDSVSVRLLGFDAYEHAQADAHALELARIVSAATTSLLPDVAPAVEIDLHFMPEGTRFSLARRVDWRAGRPYALAVFTREGMFDTARKTTAHELYHVLARASALRSTPEARGRPKAANSFGEAAADLFAACGMLLANESLARPDDLERRITIVNADTRTQMEFDGPLTDEQLVAVLKIVANDASGANAFGYLLANTALDRVFGEADTIALDTAQATTLLALCKETSPNPFALEAWLARLVPLVGATPAAAND